MNQYAIEVQVEREPAGVRLESIREAARTALDFAGIETPAQLAILLSDDKVLQRLNRLHAGHDKPTDVLSFKMDEPIPGMEPYLGDIAISVDAAERQAAVAGHSLRAELQVLTVHAVLHLLGYDHADPEQQVEMWRAQAAILAELGPDIVIPTVAAGA